MINRIETAMLAIVLTLLFIVAAAAVLDSPRPPCTAATTGAVCVDYGTGNYMCF